MNQNIRQDEKQTIAEKLKAISNKDYDDFMKEYEELRSDVDIEIDWDLDCEKENPFYCKATITTDDGEEETYLPKMAGIYDKTSCIVENCYDTFDDVIADQELLYNHKSQQMCCATYSLDKIKEQIVSFEFLDKEGLIDKKHNNFYYLFINPRKDVVEWALKNKDYFCSNDAVQKFFVQEFIDEYQANSELKELVLKQLQ